MSSSRMPPGAIRRWFAVALVAAAILLPVAGVADDEVADLPSRVGRISEFAGDLFLATPQRANEWAPIGLNYPITSGDNLWVSADGRAEIDFGEGHFRIAEDTNLQVLELDDRQLALFVASGRLILRLRALEPGALARIETPNTQVDIDRPGQYRIDVDPDRQRTTLTVSEGEAGIRFAGGVQSTLPGQAATVMGDDGAGLAIQNGFGSDSFDAWSAARDQRYDFARSQAYVSSAMVGARDLDDYGTWESTATYGPVWYPSTVAVGWAPYRFGSWTWVAPWGWTWVDAAPWGYAPFHYGRWVWLSGRWGWCPGARAVRPRWAPALVAWYGGPAWAGAGPGVYGWVPLAWGEPYAPSWGDCSSRCWRQFNQPYAVAAADRRQVSAAQRYANAAVPGAMTAVTTAVIAAARPVAPNQVNVGGLPAPLLVSAPAVAPPPRQALPRPMPAAPIPASAQYPMRDRISGSIASPPQAPQVPGGGAPEQTAPPGVSSQAVAPRRVAAPPVATAGNGGSIGLPPAVRPIQATPSSPVGLTYGGVAAGRGAYTGVAPTPGPKAPVIVDRGIALPPAPRAMPARVAPLGVVAPTFPPATPQQGAAAATLDTTVHRAAPVRPAPAAMGLPEGK